MSKIALILHTCGNDKTMALAELRSACAAPIGEMIRAMADQWPVIERTLFDRKDPDFPYRLLRLLQTLEGIGAEYVAYELMDNRAYDPREAETYYRVTAERLATMIKSRSESLEQQRRQARLEADK